MAHSQAKGAPLREHVTPYITDAKNPWTHPRDVIWPEDKSGYRVTVDTPEDLELVRRLIEEHDAASLSCGQIIAVLDADPSLAAINAYVEQKKLGE